MRNKFIVLCISIFEAVALKLGYSSCIYIRDHKDGYYLVSRSDPDEKAGLVFEAMCATAYESNNTTEKSV